MDVSALQIKSGGLLNVSYQEVTVEFIKNRLEPFLKVHGSNVLEVELSGNQWGVPHAESFCDMCMPYLVNLTKMELRDNRLGTCGWQSFQRAIISHCSNSIRYLDLSENNIYDEGGILVAQLLSQAPRLSVVLLITNQLSKNGVAPMCSKIHRLTELRLDGNSLRDAGAVMVCAAACPMLKHFSLSDNHIGDDSARSIAVWLSDTNCSLTHLNLSVNKIGPEGFTAIAEALARPRSCRSLKVLDLACNEPESAGILAVAQHIGQWRGVEQLDLTANKICNQDMLVIIARISENSGLCSVCSMEWYNNPAVLPATEKKLLEVLQHSAEKIEEAKSLEARAMELKVIVGCLLIVAVALMWRKTLF